MLDIIKAIFWTAVIAFVVMALVATFVAILPILIGVGIFILVLAGIKFIRILKSIEDQM